MPFLLRVLACVCAGLMLILAVGNSPAKALDAQPDHPEDGDHAHHEDHNHHDGDEHEPGHDADHHGEGDDVITVRATRTGRNLDDQPLRVEVINREEIEEKAIMRPGNVATLVNETGGVRVQVTSPALGAANIRMQGLFGRYTQLLSDNLPLYGGQAASIGLLQIPPTDLAQVEVIKGSASSLYGGSALGGVINLVSRTPGDAPYGEVLFNATSRDGQDLTSFSSTPLNDQFSASLTAGAHRQSLVDLDGDGWIDLPEYERISARPRLHFEGDSGANAYLTLGFMTEARRGGTRAGFTVPDGTEFAQTQDTTRFDLGLTAEQPINQTLSLNIRAAAMAQSHEHGFGPVLEDDLHETVLLEASVSSAMGGTDWIIGLAYQGDRYSADTFPEFDYTFDVPGIFAQIDHDLTETVSASLSARLDDHSAYGTQLSPRISVRYRPGDWTLRGSIARGFFAPTPFVEAIEAAGLSRLEPLEALEAETATTASVDIGYRAGSIQAGLTVFASNVDGVTQLEAVSSVPGGPVDRVRLLNSDGETQFRGSELLLRYFWNDFKFTGSYLYLDATEPRLNAAGRRDVALTPRHSAGLVAMWERHGEGRVGFEAYYTGRQSLYDNPYRSQSEPYWHLGLLGEINLNGTSLFINFENLLDIRQSGEDPIVLPARASDGQWTTDIWQNTDGLIVNGGVRFRFGG